MNIINQFSRINVTVVFLTYHQDGVISVKDIDLVMSEGLGMRYAFIGPMETMHLNAPKGKFPGLYFLLTYKNTDFGYFLTQFKIL